jgi:hypothetical protein
MKRDSAPTPLPVVARLQEAIARWEFMGWHGNAADRKKAREILPALRARLKVAQENKNAS